MIETIAFKKEHMLELIELPQYCYLKPMLSEGHLKDMEAAGFSHTVVSGSKILCCGGVSPYWPNRGEAWILFNWNDKRDLVHIHRAVLRYLDKAPFKRIEATAGLDEEFAHRWLKSLKFKLEAPKLEAYRPDGSDVSLYVRIKK